MSNTQIKTIKPDQLPNAELLSNDDILILFQNSKYAALSFEELKSQIITGNLDLNLSTITFSGDGVTASFIIPHNLPGTPPIYIVQPSSQDALGIAYITADDTNLTVVYSIAPPGGTNNITLKWLAKL